MKTVSPQLHEGLAGNVSAIADVITAAIALIAILLAVKQISSQRVSARRTDASEVVRAYFELAFNNQEYAYPRLRGELDTVGKTLGGSKTKFEKYEWFISLLLFACKQVYESKASDVGWIRVMDRQLSYHWPYFTHLHETNSNFWWDFGDHVAAKLNNIVALSTDPFSSPLDEGMAVSEDVVAASNENRND